MVKTANGMLAFIARGFEYRNRDVLLQLYRVLVRPHLKYCVQFWCPYLRKDVLAVEGIQQMFTRLIPWMTSLPNEEKQNPFELYSLEFRRVGSHRNLKILTGLDRVDTERMFPMVGGVQNPES